MVALVSALQKPCGPQDPYLGSSEPGQRPHLQPWRPGSLVTRGLWEGSRGPLWLLLLPGLLLCSSSRLVSGSSTGRLRLWAVGPVSELRCKGSGAR